MLILTILISCLLILALGLISLPFIKQQNILSIPYGLLTLFITLFSIGIYYYSGNKPGLQQWLATGKDHYQLQLQVMQLGGIDGIITRIKQKLAKNPNDIQGWIILNKLYLGKQDYKSADQAKRKIRELQLSS